MYLTVNKFFQEGKGNVDSFMRTMIASANMAMEHSEIPITYG